MVCVLESSLARFYYEPGSDVAYTISLAKPCTVYEVVDVAQRKEIVTCDTPELAADTAIMLAALNGKPLRNT